MPFRIQLLVTRIFWCFLLCFDSLPLFLWEAPVLSSTQWFSNLSMKLLEGKKHDYFVWYLLVGEWTKQLTHEWTSEQTWEQKRKVTIRLSAVEESMLIFGSCSRDRNFWWVYILSVVIERTGLRKFESKAHKIIKLPEKIFCFTTYKAMIQSNDSYIHQCATNYQKWNNFKWYINVEQFVSIS